MEASLSLEEGMDRRGLLVTHVLPNSPAERAGMVANRDLIVHLKGEDATFKLSNDNAAQIMLISPVNDAIKFCVRNVQTGRERVVEIPPNEEKNLGMRVKWVKRVDNTSQIGQVTQVPNPIELQEMMVDSRATSDGGHSATVAPWDIEIPDTRRDIQISETTTSTRVANGFGQLFHLVFDHKPFLLIIYATYQLIELYLYSVSTTMCFGDPNYKTKERFHWCVNWQHNYNWRTYGFYFLVFPIVLFVIYVTVVIRGVWRKKYKTFEYIVATTNTRRSKGFKAVLIFEAVLLLLMLFAGLYVDMTTQLKEGETIGTIEADVPSIIQQLVIVVLSVFELWVSAPRIHLPDTIDQISVMRTMRLNFKPTRTSEFVLEQVEEAIIQYLAQRNEEDKLRALKIILAPSTRTEDMKLFAEHVLSLYRDSPRSMSVALPRVRM